MAQATITLSDDLLAIAKKHAEVRGVTLSVILNDAVQLGLSERSLTRSSTSEALSRDSLFAAEFTFEDDLPADLSERFNQYSTDLAIQEHERSKRP